MRLHTIDGAPWAPNGAVGLSGEQNRRCRKNPDHLIETERPKWAVYCLECGRKRSRDWKRENLDCTKPVLPEEKEAAAERVRRWRKSHPERASELNRRYAATYRLRKREQRQDVSLLAQADASVQCTVSIARQP